MSTQIYIRAVGLYYLRIIDLTENLMKNMELSSGKKTVFFSLTLSIQNTSVISAHQEVCGDFSPPAASSLVDSLADTSCVSSSSVPF